jgi:predicted CXXCH cytochrome family protein
MTASLTPLPRVCAEELACQNCHPDKVEGRYVHAPAQAGECLTCHLLAAGKSHPRDKSSFPLKTEVARLCDGCHESKTNKRYVHTPVAAGECLACHDPHRSSNPRQLKAQGAQLCLLCHQKKYKGKRIHAPVATGNCLGCHDPHQSDNRYQLKKYGADLCLLCHKKTLREGESVHGPVADGDCVVCHDPHASGFRKLLKKNFPEELTLPYNERNYALCFDCHSNQMAAEERTVSQTNFRNGDRNLHTVHINKPDYGRSCKTCHDPHAAGQARLIRRLVPGYGKWKIPISYTKTATGGSCMVGCHKTKAYDRLETINNE